MDLTLSTPEELDHIEQAVQEERVRRQNIALIDSQVREVIATARDSGVISPHEPGAVWVQPVGAHNAYLAGDEVEHNGRRWASLIDANVWEPGVSGWREVPTDGSVGEWVPPTGFHDAYRTEDVVSFEGGVYRSLIDGNAWSPRDYPAGWQKISEVDDGGGEDTPTGPPTWEAGTAYETGDRVTYQGTVYEVLQPHTSAAHWPPDQVASLYQAVGDA